MSALTLSLKLASQWWPIISCFYTQRAGPYPWARLPSLLGFPDSTTFFLYRDFTSYLSSCCSFSNLFISFTLVCLTIRFCPKNTFLLAMCLTQGGFIHIYGSDIDGRQPSSLAYASYCFIYHFTVATVSKDVLNPICSKESNYLHKMRFFLKSLCQRLVPWLAQYLSIMWAPNFCLLHVSFSITTSVNFQNVSGVSCWFLPMTSPLTSWLSVTLLPSYPSS